MASIYNYKLSVKKKRCKNMSYYTFNLDTNSLEEKKLYFCNWEVLAPHMFMFHS